MLAMVFFCLIPKNRIYAVHIFTVTNPNVNIIIDLIKGLDSIKRSSLESTESQLLIY